MFLITSLQYNLSLAFMLIFSQSKQSRISKLSFSLLLIRTLSYLSHFSYPMPVTQNIQGVSEDCVVLFHSYPHALLHGYTEQSKLTEEY